MKTAFFVMRPRRVDDLRVPHRLEAERAYHIVKTITLPAIDYENFVTDMLVDREFIENASSLCTEDREVVNCLLVKQRGKNAGVLVVPEDREFVKCAAYLDSID